MCVAIVERVTNLPNTVDNVSAHAPGMPVVAVVGDGQLARMMQTEAVELGQSIRLLAGALDASAAQVAADVVLGDYTNLDDLRRAARGASVVTFDHEHVPTEHLTTLMAEKKVELVRELSAMVARTPSGEVASWPVVESVQVGGVCAEAVAPAPDLREDRASQSRELAVQIATELGVTGVLAVELFEDAEGIWVNELAMRPHNTGHWTQDGCVTSQFEQHLRAVLDLPLGSTDMLAETTVMANVLGGPDDPDMPMPQRMAEVWRRFPDAKIHLYGKTWRPGRKIGHVNVSGNHPAASAALRRRAQLAAHFLVHAVWADGYVS